MKAARTILFAGAALALAACSDQSPTEAGRRPTSAPVLNAAANGVDGEYVIVLKEGANPRSVAAIAGVSPRHVYTAALNGFSASLNQGQLNALQHNPNVEYIEQDQIFSVDATQSGATWGIDRIDQRSRPLSGTYTYTSTASNVTAYIIDTGIQPDHPNFGGRGQAVYGGTDCNGHGTHVAGTIGSTTYGIAKSVRLRGVRVLGCSGSGTTSGIIAGVDWVRANATKPAVANMSLGGGVSSSLNTAVGNLASSGVFVAVAAGNESQNACNVSPASTSAVLTVAASTSTDARASYSNYGSCVDIYAPGSSVTSTWINSGTRSISGTSMASPHAAGVAALYKGNYGDASQSTINSWIINNSTANVITGNPTGTPNRLLYKGAL
ncbi:MAG TPA: S8 family peptidase [Longimicrobium sp.]|nr:S8 family peptidase [Longimicrobium sp.]